MAQRLNLTINSIKVFGERHCGTNAIAYFVGKNFNLKLHHHDFLGWKHRLAPKKTSGQSLMFKIAYLFFVCVIPIHGLKPCTREPYYDHYPKIKDLSLENFIQFSIEDYENCIAMWNQKNDSYLGCQMRHLTQLLSMLRTFRC